MHKECRLTAVAAFTETLSKIRHSRQWSLRCSYAAYRGQIAKANSQSTHFWSRQASRKKFENRNRFQLQAERMLKFLRQIIWPSSDQTLEKYPDSGEESSFRLRFFHRVCAAWVLHILLPIPTVPLHLRVTLATFWLNFLPLSSRWKASSHPWKANTLRDETTARAGWKMS